MTTESTDLSVSARSAGNVPRALWIGGGLLALVTAGMAGALIMRSAEPAATSLASAQTVAAPANVTNDIEATHPNPTAPPAKAARTAKSGALPPVNTQSNWNSSDGTTRAAACANCGVVEAVNPVQRKGQGTGLGAVAGGLIGGVVGHQAGGGSGKTALTVLGAIGGGLAGNEVEKRARAETAYEVHVRMEDGSLRVFQRGQPMSVGTHVVADGSTLRVRGEAGQSTEPRMLHTATNPGGAT